VLSRPYGSDPASVAFDAINHARARNIDVVLIDTAGRMQTDKNLMAELAKIHRVAEPDLVIFVGDALAGNDAIEQAKTFNEKIGIDAAVLTKVDADAKGGAALSIAVATGKPIIFVGVGQEYPDLEAFNPEWFTQKIAP
jgi:fused signal recognition particle receptor